MHTVNRTLFQVTVELTRAVFPFSMLHSAWSRSGGSYVLGFRGEEHVIAAAAPAKSWLSGVGWSNSLRHAFLVLSAN